MTVIGGHLKSGEVAHDAALAQAVLLVDHSLQQHGGVQAALHQEVGLALLHKSHRLAGGLGQVELVVDVLGGDGLAQLGQDLIDDGLVAHQHGGNDALGAGTEDSLEGVLVAGGGYRHAGAVGLALHVGDELIKIMEYHKEDLLSGIVNGRAGDAP